MFYHHFKASILLTSIEYRYSLKLTVSCIGEPDFIDHKIHLDRPPAGYKCIKVLVPYPDNAITEEEALKHPVMKKVKNF